MKYYSFDFFSNCVEKTKTQKNHSAHRLYKNRPACCRLQNLALNSGGCGKPALQIRKLAQGITKCLVQGQRILDLGALSVFCNSIGPLPILQVPRFRFRRRIHVQDPSVHHRPCCARMLAVFNRVCFSDTKTDVQVLSNTKARFKLLPNYSPLLLARSPFGNFLSFLRGVGTPPPPPRSRRPSQPHPCWLGRLPRQPRGTQIWGGEVC